MFVGMYFSLVTFVFFAELSLNHNHQIFRNLIVSSRQEKDIAEICQCDQIGRQLLIWEVIFKTYQKVLNIIPLFIIHFLVENFS
jgi:hypothetical protein